jgi:hypothetical protein
MSRRVRDWRRSRLTEGPCTPKQGKYYEKTRGKFRVHFAGSLSLVSVASRVQQNIDKARILQADRFVRGFFEIPQENWPTRETAILRQQLYNFRITDKPGVDRIGQQKGVLRPY